MPLARRWCLLLLVSAACSSAPPRPADELGPRGDARTILPADLVDATQLSLLDFIVAERPRWLRGADGRTQAVDVYLNDAAAGGSASLREIALRDVTSARYLDLTAAQQRYGGHLRTPVILVTLREK